MKIFLLKVNFLKLRDKLFYKYYNSKLSLHKAFQSFIIRMQYK